MTNMKRVMTMAGVAVLIGAAVPVWAESAGAPVYDVEAFGSATASEPQDVEYPMPPAPGDETAQTKPVRTDAGSDTSGEQTPAVSGAGVGIAAAAPDANDALAAPGAGVSVSTENMTPEVRMHRLEQQIANMQNSQSVAQLESMQTEIQSLRGQVEQLNHQLDTVKAEKKAIADKQMTADSGASVDSSNGSDAGTFAAGVGVAKKPAVKKTASTKRAETDNSAKKTVTADSGSKNQPDAAEEQKIYQTAYDLIKAKKYDLAVNALQSMLKKYPDGQFASNAHYWLGELYGLMGKNDNALDEFTTVISKFPDSPRVSDAQLKVGLILAAQSKWPDAKRTFKTVINRYPGTASSRLASEQLKQIKQAGH